MITIIYRILLAIFLTISYSRAVAAVTCTSGLSYMGVATATSVNIAPTPITWSGPANSMSNIKAFTTVTTGSEQNVFYCFYTNPSLNAKNSTPQVWLSPSDTPLSGITYTANGVNYPIFPTDIAGIGYIGR